MPKASSFSVIAVLVLSEPPTLSPFLKEMWAREDMFIPPIPIKKMLFISLSILPIASAPKCVFGVDICTFLSGLKFVEKQKRCIIYKKHSSF
jgi:hypothetical protein